MAILSRFLKLVSLVFLSSSSNVWAQPNEKITGEALVALALSGWDSQCADRGCIMFRDVPIGDPSHPFDATDPQFITIAVAIERQGNKIAYIAFKTPTDSDTSKPLRVRFVQTEKAGSKFNVVAETDPVALPYELPCNQNSCDVRIPNGVVEASAGSQELDLFQLMMSNTFIRFTVSRKGIDFSPIESLLRFQEDYRKLFAKGLVN